MLDLTIACGVCKEDDQEMHPIFDSLCLSCAADVKREERGFNAIYNSK